jgi:hypothetical protein
MSLDKFTDVTINDFKFRVGTVSAKVGSWATMMMMGGKAADFEVFDKLRSFLFQECLVYVKAAGTDTIIPMRMFDKDRKDKNGASAPWLEAGIEDDLDTVNQLYAACLDWNFSSFFAKWQERKLLAEAQATSQPSSLTI